MNLRIDLHKNFIKSFSKLPPKIKKHVIQKLDIFKQNPFADELNNHALLGKYQGYRSINITGDYRAIYLNTSEESVLFARIGTHAQLYNK